MNRGTRRRLLAAAAAAVAATVVLVVVGRRSDAVEPVVRPLAGAPAWAFLDRAVSGTADQKRAVLVDRLLGFLEASVEAVAPDADVAFRDPLGRLGCGSGESTEARSAVVSGLPGSELRALPGRFAALWSTFGYPVHRVQQVSTDQYDTIEVNGFHIEVAVTEAVPLRLEGSIPCVGD